MCTVSISQIFYERGNPWWKVATNAGLDLVDVVVDGATRTHFDAVDAGTRRHVAASEPISWMSESIRRGTTFARGIGLSMSGSPVVKLMASGVEALPRAQTFSAPGGPILVSGEGLAFSTTEQRLYVLGGLTSGGNPKNIGWMLNATTGQWRSFNMPAGETVGTVLAMVYRREDRAIYFLDKSGSQLRLRRWNAQRKLSSGALTTLATFPPTWNAFTKYSIVAGAKGDLGVVAWGGTSSEKTRLARFSTSSAHRVALVAISKLTTPIAAAPSLTPDRFAFSIASTNPTASQLLFTSMGTPVPADTPTILPH